VAERLGMSLSWVSRVESGKGLVSLSELATLLDLYRVEDTDQRQSLEELVRGAKRQDWLSPYAGTLSSAYRQYIGLEQAASELLVWEPTIVHGLLQTEDYARALLMAAEPPFEPETVEQKIRVRMQRQANLAEVNAGMRLWAVLDESVLRRKIGGAEVHRDQLRTLLDASRRPNTRIQIMPFADGAHSAMTGAFTIIEFPPGIGDAVLYAEGLVGDTYLQGADVDRYRLGFQALRAAALNPERSQRMIGEALEAG
jgi:transcriptional regulator with XRE-family HTH domain